MQSKTVRFWQYTEYSEKKRNYAFSPKTYSRVKLCVIGKARYSQKSVYVGELWILKIHFLKSGLGLAYY